MSTDAPAKLSYSDISDWVWNEFRTGVHFDAAQITSGVFAVDRVPGLPASKITSGEINANRVPGLPASKITSGEIHVDRIPQLDAATKIIGVLPISLGGTGGTTAASARLNLGVPLPTTETPEAPTKEGSVGNLSTTFARGDHSHPEQTTIAYVAAPSTQATDTLPIALESPTYPGSESSYSGFYSPAHSTIVMRAGADSYKFEYNKVTLGEDVDFIGRSDDADINDPKPLYISGASATTKGGTIALGGSNYPSLSLRVDNKSYLYLSEGAAFPVTIGDNTYVHGNLETSGYVSADALYGNSAQAERMTLTPIARSSLPASMPSSGVIYFDYDDSKFYGRVNNSWQVLNSSSEGGSVTSADKLNTDAGSATQPVYFADGVPVATTYSLGKSVPSNAVFTDTTYSNMVGATTSVAGTAGLVPAPPAGEATRYLRSDGTWQVLNLSSADITLSGLSEKNFSSLDNKPTTLSGYGITDGVNTSDTRLSDARPASDVSAWAKAANKPSYTYSEVGAAASSHTHDYAGSSSAGGAATSADKLNTNAGSVTQPVYFANGVPVATTYSLGKSVPSNAVFTDTTYSANNGVSLSGTTFSNSGVRSIATGGTNGTISVNTNGTSANVAVKGLGTAAYTASTAYAASGHTHNYAGSSSAGGSATSAEKVNNALTITLNGGSTEGTDKFTYDGSAAKTVDISGGGDDGFYTVGLDFLKTSIDSFSCSEFEQYPALVSAPVVRLITMPSELTTPHIFEWINEDYSVADMYTDGPVHGKGNYAFYGSTLMPNGKVMLTPHDSANIGIYDPTTDTYIDGPAHGKGTHAFIGSTLMPNGKVMLTPHHSANIGIYDPVENTYTDGPAHGKGGFAFAGGTMLPNGKVMLTPHLSANIGIYDPVENTYTDGPANDRSFAFYGSTLLPNGKVMLVPYNSANIRIYDPVANTFTIGPAHGKYDGNSAFIGSTLMPNGKVMLVPYGSPNIGIYDPIANTYTDGPAHGKGTQAFNGSVLLPNGKVMLVPFDSTNIGIYDPDANTYTDGPAHGKFGYVFFGSTLLPNGKVMLTPHNSANIGIYDPEVTTYTDGPAHEKGGTAFSGSVLMPNGKVMLVPRSSPTIGIYDPIAGTYTDGPAHGKGSTAFSGSVLMPNGKVMLVPRSSPTIGIYDPIAGTYTDGPAHGKSGAAFYGSVLMPNGKVMLVPTSSPNIGIYDPLTNTYTDGPLHGKSTNAFTGGTMMPNGKVMLVPRTSASIGIYDPVANTYTDGPTHMKGTYAFYGGTMMPNGKVMLVPNGSANIGIYDPITDTYTDGPAHGKIGYPFSGCTLMPNGKVMLVPSNSANIGIYDPITDTYTDGPEHGKSSAAFDGGTMMPNGKVLLTPYNSPNIGIYDPAINDLELRDWHILSAYFNKF
jgi:hypothetical protein